MMEQLLLKEYSRLPEHLQAEVLHFVQFLAEKVRKQTRHSNSGVSKRPSLTFADFRFPENGKSYSRSEIYGDYGR
jgi:hypothetical protein